MFEVCLGSNEGSFWYKTRLPLPKAMLKMKMMPSHLTASRIYTSKHGQWSLHVYLDNPLNWMGLVVGHKKVIRVTPFMIFIDGTTTISKAMHKNKTKNKMKIKAVVAPGTSKKYMPVLSFICRGGWLHILNWFLKYIKITFFLIYFLKKYFNINTVK